MSFEGSEKRLEIGFFVPSVCPAGLRQISRSDLDQIMKQAQCSIISHSQSEDTDAYVLSESSCFLTRDLCILKTCGRTRLINAIDSIRDATSRLGMTVDYVKYSRASFLSPEEQHFPHQKFETEVACLNELFPDLKGSAYVLGDQLRRLQWHLFYGSVSGECRSHRGSSIEICLKGLDPSKADLFVRNPSFIDARTTTYTSGIAQLLPDAILDDYMFEPCGYSMNGLSKSGIQTVHVTPEKSCSYASIEFSCLKPHAVSLKSTLLRVMQMFEPKELHIAVHTFNPNGPSSFLLELQESLPGHFSDGLSIQYLSNQSQVIFKAYILQKNTPRLQSPSSISSSSDTIFIASADENTQTSLTPTLEKQYDIQNVRHVEEKNYIKQLIKEKELRQTFYVMNLSLVRHLYLQWRLAFPRVEPFYAVKCNPDVVLLRVLGSLGAGFDVASKTEMELVLSIGTPVSKIIFANACKHPDDIRDAEACGVYLTTFDSATELVKLKEGAPNAMALLRIRADDPDARCMLGNKFGAMRETWAALLRKAKELRVRVMGVSFHVGSGSSNPSAFCQAIEDAKEAFDMGIKFGFSMSILDIGGGFYSGMASELEPVTNAVNGALDRYFPLDSGIKIIAEPGRYFAERCATLACYIQGFRERVSSQDVLHKDYYLTDGLYGSFNCILYDHANPQVMPLKLHDDADSDGKYCTSTVFGPTCDGFDTVMVDTVLPEMHIGDWLVFPNMGAYTLAGACNFNGINATDVKIHYVWADFKEE